MRVVRPITMTDSILVSTIPEPDASVSEVLWTAGTYNAGDERIKTTTHRNYRATSTTNEDPEVGVLSDPPTWIDFAPTNKYAMFDSVNGTVSTDSTALDVDITPGEVANSVSGFNITGASTVTVIMDDPADGEVYNTVIDMVDNSDIFDYWEYFFEPIINKTEFSLLGLPAYNQATLSINFAGDADISVGTLVIGKEINLGIARYGGSLKLLDFSKKTQDEFGNFIITQGRTSKLVEFDVAIPAKKTKFVFNTLSALTTTPSVWIGSDDIDDASLVFGYYRDSQINISNPTFNDCTITVEGLI